MFRVEKLNIIVFTVHKSILSGLELTESFFYPFEFKVKRRIFSSEYYLMDLSNDQIVHSSTVFSFNLLASQLFFFNSRVIGNCKTNPACRGQGLYGKMVKYIAATNPQKHFILFVNVSNTASIRGLQKIGCAELGTYRIKRFLKIIYCFNKTWKSSTSTNTSLPPKAPGEPVYMNSQRNGCKRAMK